MSAILVSVVALASSGLAASSDGVADEIGVPETIIVTGFKDPSGATGSKTDTPLRDLPAAVSVVSKDVLNQQDVRGLDGALVNASAVAPVFGGGYGIADNYVIRGLPMRFLRNGLPDGSTFNGYKRTLADVASIEVLKGPGSAVYGRGEAGGSVNIVTRQPGDAWAGEALASYGSYNSATLTGLVGGPVGEHFATQITANYERSDGYRGLARSFTDILPMATAQLGDHQLTVNYDHRDQRFTIDNYGIPFTVNRSLDSVDPSARLYSPFNFSQQKIDRVTISDRYQAMPDLMLRAALVYDHRDIALARNAGGNVLNAANVMTGRNGRTQVDAAEYLTGQFEAVWSPLTGALKHTFLLGTEFSSIRIDTVRRTYNLPDVAVINGVALVTDPAVVPTATTLAFDRAIRSDTLSAYAQDQIAIDDKFKLRGGIRMDSVKLVDAGLFAGAAARIAGTSNLISWQAGAVWQPMRSLSLYGGYSRGKFMAINTEAANLSSNFAKRAAPLPESSEQFELGFKAEPIAGLMQINGAVFETNRKDFFVTLVTGADPVQAGKQRSRGAEIDLVATPTRGLTLSGNAAFVDAINLSTALVTVV